MENNASILQNEDAAIEAIGLIDSLNEMAMQMKAQAYTIEVIFRDIAVYGRPSDDATLDYIGRMLTEPIESISDKLKDLAEEICEKVVANG